MASALETDALAPAMIPATASRTAWCSAALLQRARGRQVVALQPPGSPASSLPG